MPKSRSQAASDDGHVRIIAGQYRGRRLPVVHVDGLRPTGDRVRETVFNWLQNDVPGARCLDAFAGTGALGFEAASRYAASVTLVEQNRAAAMAVQRSQQLLNSSKTEIIHDSFESFAASKPQPFDLIFLDPPFQQSNFSLIVERAHSILASAGVVYLESPKHLSDQNLVLPKGWELRRDKTFGDVRARLFDYGE